MTALAMLCGAVIFLEVVVWVGEYFHRKGRF